VNFHSLAVYGFKIIMLEEESSMLIEGLKCPACSKEPNPERLAMIITEGSAYNIAYFGPDDPVIV
jgi:hypothetical protein